MGYRIVTSIIAAAQSHNLTDLATVKSDLGITGGSDDTFLTNHIARVSAAVEQYCNRTFVVEVVRDDIYPDRTSWQVISGLTPLQLSRWPVTELDAGNVIENGIVLVQDTDFILDATLGQLHRLDGESAPYPRAWPAFKISVTYSAGYESIPGDIVDAVIRMIKARYDARGRDPYLKERNIPGVIEQQWWVAAPGELGNMPPDVVDLLDNYRVPVVA